MTKIKTALPTCPVCEKALDAICENEYWTYSFDEKTGTYEKDLVDIEIRCPNCNFSVRSRFPEGVCNYRTPTPKSTG